MSQMDARAFKDKQRAAWSAAAAGWEKWVDLFEQGGHTMSSRMVDLAQVAAGSSVLDIASGPGDPGLVAADRVGPTGRVTLTAGPRNAASTTSTSRSPTRRASTAPGNSTTP